MSNNIIYKIKIDNGIEKKTLKVFISPKRKGRSPEF